MTDASERQTDESTLAETAKWAIDDVLETWRSATNDAIENLQPPRIASESAAAPASMLAFGFNILNHSYPHVAPHLTTSTAKALNMTLSRFALPVYATVAVHRQFADQYAQLLDNVDDTIKTDFLTVKRSIKTQVNDVRDHFYSKDRQTRDKWEEMVQILVEHFRSESSNGTHQPWDLRSRMKRKLKNDNLVETDENIIGSRVTNAFVPLKEKVELIASHSPTLNTWYTNYLGRNYYRLLWAPRGQSIADDPEYPETPRPCSEGDSSDSDWCVVDQQSKARELMLKAFQMDVHELPSQIKHHTHLFSGGPTPNHFNHWWVHRVAVINRMPNRSPRDLIPEFTQW